MDAGDELFLLGSAHGQALVRAPFEWLVAIGENRRVDEEETVTMGLAKRLRLPTMVLRTSVHPLGLVLVLALAFGRPAGLEATLVVEENSFSALDGVAGDHFGRGVAIDGTTAVVGASQRDENGIVDVGAAYVFIRQGDRWIQQARLAPPDLGNNPDQGDRYGFSVAIQGDAAVVGAFQHKDPSDPGNLEHGAVYIWGRDQIISDESERA